MNSYRVLVRISRRSPLSGLGGSYDQPIDDYQFLVVRASDSREAWIEAEAQAEAIYANVIQATSIASEPA